MLQSEEKNCPSNFQYESQNLCVIDREKEREREKESNRDREKERKMREERECELRFRGGSKKGVVKCL